MGEKFKNKFLKGKSNFLLFCLLGCLTLSSCGTLTGIPGHGGGKRFAIEQELVAAATRGAIKQIDLSEIKGKKVNLYVNAIGDNGNGNILGGRFNIASQLRGDYLHAPATEEFRTFPRYTSTTRSESGSSTSSSESSTGSSSNDSNSTLISLDDDGGLLGNNTTSSTSSTNSSSEQSASSRSSGYSTSTTESTLPLPETITTQQQGTGGVVQVGVDYQGLGAYVNSDRISSNDLQYLSALMQTYLYLQEVYVVPPSEAEIDVYVTVDVFGTVRSRVEWFLANNEILRAKASFEVMAVDHATGKLVMQPQTANAQSEYNEQYILWAGPIIIKKTLNKSEPLLSDFTDVVDHEPSIEAVAHDIPIIIPFQYDVEDAEEQ